MARVKRGVTSRAKHKKVLKAVKGQWGKDMDPYFSETKWETMNFYEPLIHNMESDAGVKPVFAQWMI